MWPKLTPKTDLLSFIKVLFNTINIMARKKKKKRRKRRRKEKYEGDLQRVPTGHVVKSAGQSQNLGGQPLIFHLRQRRPTKHSQPPAFFQQPVILVPDF
jgi:3-deoxy-D-manno-octulosonic-acid transferase